MYVFDHGILRRLHTFVPDSRATRKGPSLWDLGRIRLNFPFFQKEAQERLCDQALGIPGVPALKVTGFSRLNVSICKKYVFTTQCPKKKTEQEKESYVEGCWMLIPALGPLGLQICNLGLSAQHPRPLHTHHHSTVSSFPRLPHRPLSVSATAWDPNYDLLPAWSPSQNWGLWPEITLSPQGSSQTPSLVPWNPADGSLRHSSFLSVDLCTQNFFVHLLGAVSKLLCYPSSWISLTAEKASLTNSVGQPSGI